MPSWILLSFNNNDDDQFMCYWHILIRWIKNVHKMYSWILLSTTRVRRQYLLSCVDIVVLLRWHVLLEHTVYEDRLIAPNVLPDIFAKQQLVFLLFVVQEHGHRQVQASVIHAMRVYYVKMVRWKLPTEQSAPLYVSSLR